jgi:hypothetical protein
MPRIKSASFPDDSDQPSPLDNVTSTDPQIANWFLNHKMDQEQTEQIERIRKASSALAQIIRDNTPKGPDQSDALRRVRQAMMMAHAAVANRGK